MVGHALSDRAILKSVDSICAISPVPIRTSDYYTTREVDFRMRRQDVGGMDLSSRLSPSRSEDIRMSQDGPGDLESRLHV